MATQTYWGVVKLFKEDKSYGFLECPEIEGDVFFHRDNGVGFYHDGTEPVGDGIPPARIPEPGDRICFELSANGGKQRAAPWGFVDEYEALGGRVFVLEVPASPSRSKARRDRAKRWPPRVHVH